MEEEAYASSEEEAPEDEEPLQVKTRCVLDVCRPPVCLRPPSFPSPVPSPLETCRVPVCPSPVEAHGPLWGGAYKHHLIFFFSKTPPSFRLRTQFPIIYILVLFVFVCYCSVCASHSHSPVLDAARITRANTNTAAPRSAPTPAATPSMRCRRCRASATTAPASAW